jgi:hypothetical protein
MVNPICWRLLDTLPIDRAAAQGFPKNATSFRRPPPSEPYKLTFFMSVRL